MNDYGHVDDDTPSFAISLDKGYRGKGIGTDLMRRMLERLKEQGYVYEHAASFSFHAAGAGFGLFICDHAAVHSDHQ